MAKLKNFMKQILWFAELMRFQMCANRHKKGWLDFDFFHCNSNIILKMTAISKAIGEFDHYCSQCDNKNSLIVLAKIQKEAANLGNYAMMAALKAENLKKKLKP